MIAIPDGLERGVTGVEHLVQSGSGCLVAYRATQPTASLSTLVTRPTLVLVRSGRKRLHNASGREIFEIADGRMVLMSPGLRIMSEMLTPEGTYESVIIGLDPALLARTLPLTPTLSEIPLSACVLDPPPALRARVESLRDRQPEGIDGRLLDLELEAVALELARGPDRCRAILAHAMYGAQSADAARLRQIMAEHFRAPLQLPDYATLAGRSLSSFKRDFRRVYGAAPGAWLIRERLAYAAQRLAEDELSVTEVCLASGFGDLSHFIRSFRRRYAESPRRYRQRLQGDHRGA